MMGSEGSRGRGEKKKKKKKKMMMRMMMMMMRRAEVCWSDHARFDGYSKPLRAACRGSPCMLFTR